MSPNKKSDETHVDWARRINGRWIVRRDLRDHAEAYLKHLEASDPARLLQSCQLAHEMLKMRAWLQDPKPWFYTGLFGLATPLEVAEYASEHSLLAAVLSPSQTGNGWGLLHTSVRDETMELIKTLRTNLERCKAFTLPVTAPAKIDPATEQSAS
jgi:hypothetical protein